MSYKYAGVCRPGYPPAIHHLLGPPSCRLSRMPIRDGVPAAYTVLLCLQADHDRRSKISASIIIVAIIAVLALHAPFTRSMTEPVPKITEPSRSSTPPTPPRPQP